MAGVDPLDATPDQPDADDERPERPVEEEEPELEAIRQTAPAIPWTVNLRQSVTYFQKLPGGGMRMVLVPAVKGPGGTAVPMPPGVEVEFGADGWGRFQAQVANDGEQPPEVAIATHLPPGMRP